MGRSWPGTHSLRLVHLDGRQRQDVHVLVLRGGRFHLHKPSRAFRGESSTKGTATPVLTGGETDTLHLEWFFTTTGLAKPQRTPRSATRETPCLLTHQLLTSVRLRRARHRMRRRTCWLDGRGVSCFKQARKRSWATRVKVDGASTSSRNVRNLLSPSCSWFDPVVDTRKYRLDF